MPSPEADREAAQQILRQAGLGQQAEQLGTVELPGEREAIAAERALRSGGAATPGEEPSADPTDIGGYHEDRRNGYDKPAAERRYIQRLFNAAADGDERVLDDPDRAKLAADGYVDRNGVARLRR